jgi:hypothetical protein
MMDSSGDVAYQVGIVSWGYGCADAGFYGVYADVAWHLAWVESYLHPWSCVDDIECEGDACSCEVLAGVSRRRLGSTRLARTVRKLLFGHVPDPVTQYCECMHS